MCDICHSRDNVPHYTLTIDRPGQCHFFSGFNSAGQILVTRDIIMAHAVPAHQLAGTINEIKTVIFPCEVRYAEFDVKPYLTQKQLKLLNLC